MRRQVALLFGIVWLGLAPTGAQAVSEYTITDLGTIGNFRTQEANAISDTGIIVGWGHNSLSQQRGFSYGGSLTEFSYTAWPYGWGIYPKGVNDAGLVVGTVNADGNYGFAYVDNTMLSFGRGGEALAVNNNGVVVGSQSWDAFYYDVPASSGEFLPKPGTSARATAINDQGIIAGTYVIDGASRACYWANKTLVDAGTLGGGAETNAINSHGDIVGSCYLTSGSTECHATLCGVGQPMVDLTTLGFTLGGTYSAAWGINDHRQIIGCSRKVDGTLAALLYENGSAYELNSLIDSSLGWNLETAYDINNSGAIVGRGYLNGEATSRAFLMTPVPEPTTNILLLAGGLAFWIWRKLP
jgi:uncharacterized membrane protein